MVNSGSRIGTGVRASRQGTGGQEDSQQGRSGQGGGGQGGSEQGNGSSGKGDGGHKGGHDESKRLWNKKNTFKK